MIEDLMPCDIFINPSLRISMCIEEKKVRIRFVDRENFREIEIPMKTFALLSIVSENICDKEVFQYLTEEDFRYIEENIS